MDRHSPTGTASIFPHLLQPHSEHHRRAVSFLYDSWSRLLMSTTLPTVCGGRLVLFQPCCSHLSMCCLKSEIDLATFTCGAPAARSDSICAVNMLILTA